MVDLDDSDDGDDDSDEGKDEQHGEIVVKVTVKNIGSVKGRKSYRSMSLRPKKGPGLLDQ